MTRARTRRTRRKRTTVRNPESHSCHPHSSVGLIDDSDDNGETLYQVSRPSNDNDDNEEDEYWNDVIARAHQRAEAARSSSPRTSTVVRTDEEVLPHDVLYGPQDGDKPIWRLKCHVSHPRILSHQYLDQYTSPALKIVRLLLSLILQKPNQKIGQASYQPPIHAAATQASYTSRLTPPKTSTTSCAAFLGS